jgi:hypothetical protein
MGILLNPWETIREKPEWPVRTISNPVGMRRAILLVMLA